MQPHVRKSLSTLPFARTAGPRVSLLIAVSAFVLAMVLATPGQANASQQSLVADTTAPTIYHSRA